MGAMLRPFLIALAILAVSAAPAQACRGYRLPADRIAGLYQHKDFAGALLVRVAGARYTEPARPDYHPWQADATIRRSFDAGRGTGTIRFGRSGSTSACDDLTPVPKRGDLWVLYLSKSGDGHAVVNLSYPLAVARREDPRLAARLR
jgi:hypothetical protein